MSIISILAIAIGLAMDAFAVSITSGILIKEFKNRHALKISAFFGVAQGVMPLIGYVLGYSFKSYIESVDHWIAFIMLGFIGGKMILESRKSDEEKEDFNPLNNKVLISLAIATSIDALVVGVGFAFLQVSVISSCTMIAVVTFLICFLGVFIGRKSGDLFKSKAELIGGIILVIMGIKILIEHLFF